MLRLGDTELELRELAQLVRGSAAKFRLLVVDACRAGELTRTKGGRVVAPFEIAQAELGGEGMALLTAAAATEDAQESDEIRGSFFTHAFVSGLLGAADRNGDGTVVLEETYQHAYNATIASTSRTFAGTQHPTFQYEVKGQGGRDFVVLPRRRGRLPSGLRLVGARRSSRILPEPVEERVGSDSQLRLRAWRERRPHMGQSRVEPHHRSRAGSPPRPPDVRVSRFRASSQLAGTVCAPAGHAHCVPHSTALFRLGRPTAGLPATSSGDSGRTAQAPGPDRHKHSARRGLASVAHPRRHGFLSVVALAPYPHCCITVSQVVPDGQSDCVTQGV